MEEILEIGKNLGEVLKSYHRVAVALNSFKEQKVLTIKELADRAKVHWNTAKKALLFFDMIKTVIPEFELSPDLKFKVIKKPDPFKAVEGIFSSLEMRVLTKMMLCRALDPESARSLKEILSKNEFEVLPKLISKGYVNSFEGLYYLSRRGISIGGLGLKKLIESGVALPWQKTSISAIKLATPARSLRGAVLFVEEPTYLGQQYRRIVAAPEYTEGWAPSLERGDLR